MHVPDLKLEAISFSAAPTKSQLVNTLRTISTFLSNMGASLILDGSYNIGEQALGETLNSAIKLKQCADLFENSPGASGLAVPQAIPGPRPVRQ